MSQTIFIVLQMHMGVPTNSSVIAMPNTSTKPSCFKTKSEGLNSRTQASKNALFCQLELKEHNKNNGVCKELRQLHDADTLLTAIRSISNKALKGYDPNILSRCSSASTISSMLQSAPKMYNNDANPLPGS